MLLQNFASWIDFALFEIKRDCKMWFCTFATKFETFSKKSVKTSNCLMLCLLPLQQWVHKLLSLKPDDIRISWGYQIQLLDWKRGCSGNSDLSIDGIQLQVVFNEIDTFFLQFNQKMATDSRWTYAFWFCDNLTYKGHKFDNNQLSHFNFFGKNNA